ncbi:MAG: HNH endonuclease, partial [Bacteroidales bacterium]|nr:HNH endonuclease [Candidatus Latescibacterota bacterium]
KADRATKVKSVVEVAKVKPAAKVERVAKKVKKTEEKTETSPATPAAPAKGPEGPLASPESSRFIPQAIKDKVFKRDGGKCAFTGPGGQRCGSKWNIQVDHITPFALGGSNLPENLQLLCRRHNQHKAVKDFGKKKIDGHLKRG